ncbi:34265_t:CDS:2, partial [Gigaspora margarita]
EILKEQPRNAQIKYEASHMDKRIWKLISLQAKETDKLLSKVAYRSSATLRPLDNTLRAIYYTKPDTNLEALQAWNCIESSLKDTKVLLLDNLSYINDLRRQQSLKVISPNYTLSSEKEKVFGDDLNSIIERENATNKLFNKAANNHKKQYQNYKGNVSRPIYIKTTTMGVAQGHIATTRTQCPIKERANSRPSWHTHTIKEGYCPEWHITSPLNIFSLDQYHIVPLELSGKIQKLLRKWALSYHWCSTSIETNDTISNKRQKLSSEKIWMGHPINSILSEHPTTQLGAIKNHEVIYDHWTQTQRRLYINILELKAIHYALLSFETIKDQTIMIKLDNMTAVAYLNYQGSTISRELSLLAEDIWNLCLNQKIKIIAQYLSGKLNIQANWASRGPFTINLFASKRNAQLQYYFSRFPDPSALAIDALKQDWPRETLWANPPWILIPKILSKAILDKAIPCIIIPEWKMAPCPITNQLTQSPSKPKMEDVCLLNIRTKLQAKKFLEEVIKKIQEATNKSSNATIGSSINKWCVWCYERSIDPIQGLLENIIEFLNNMSNQNKVFNIIASYRTAISKIYNHIDGYQVGRHPEIAKFMIAICKINPSPSPLDNGLDILPSLNFIVSLDANDSMSILDLSWKTAFLIALGTASRPSNLQRIDLRTLCKSKQRILLEITNPKEVNISIAHGGNKYRTKKIFIDYYDNYDLCPVSTMLKLLD